MKLTPEMLGEMENYIPGFKPGMGCCINCSKARKDLPLLAETLREVGRRAKGVVSEEGPANLSDGFDLLRELAAFAPKEKP